MSPWVSLRTRLIRLENGIIAVLLLLAVLLVAPAVRTLMSPSPAELAQWEVREHLDRIRELANREGCVYSVKFVPGTREVRVYRWQPDTGKRVTEPEPAPELKLMLSRGVLVDSTTLSKNILTISEHGNMLSRGQVVLRGPNGSKAYLDFDTES